jgi:hypothetical protein
METTKNVCNPAWPRCRDGGCMLERDGGFLWQIIAGKERRVHGARYINGNNRGTNIVLCGTPK